MKVEIFWETNNPVGLEKQINDWLEAMKHRIRILEKTVGVTGQMDTTVVVTIWYEFLRE